MKEQHPEAFEEAKAYEKNSVEHGSPFTWSQGEALEELEKPERTEQISRTMNNALHACNPKYSLTPYDPTMIPWILMIYMGRRRFVWRVINSSILKPRKSFSQASSLICCVRFVISSASQAPASPTVKTGSMAQLYSILESALVAFLLKDDTFFLATSLSFVSTP